MRKQVLSGIGPILHDAGPTGARIDSTSGWNELNLYSRRAVQCYDDHGLRSVIFNSELQLLEAMRQVLYRPLRNLCGEKLPTYGVNPYWLSRRNLSDVPSTVVPHDRIMHDMRGSAEGESRSIKETQSISMLDPDERLDSGYEICDRFSLVIQNQTGTTRDEVGEDLTLSALRFK